jgi:hypothetical protein
VVLNDGGNQAIRFCEIEIHRGSNKKARQNRGGRPFNFGVNSTQDTARRVPQCSRWWGPATVAVDINFDYIKDAQVPAPENYPMQNDPETGFDSNAG